VGGDVRSSLTAAERVAAAATTGLSAPKATPVAAAMAGEILAVGPGASLADLAHTMAEARVHSVVVAARQEDGSLADGPWGFVSDLDLVTAAAGDDGPELPRPAVTVPANATLVDAGRLMGRHEVAHLVVTDESGRRALGVISALDVARHIAFGNPER
jgi:CBS domain-containing protein